jgi:hypothetical protein
MADLLWVQESSPISVFRDGNYPVLPAGKGTTLHERQCPLLRAYPGLRVPRPLLLVPHENTDSTILTLARDVLALTKVSCVLRDSLVLLFANQFIIINDN